MTNETIHPGDPHYPTAVAHILKKPPTLYCRGNQSLLEAPHILGVIGSRIITHENENDLRRILDEAQHPSISIVSGLALGIDALSHELALAHGMQAIAIPGSSVEPDEVYPRSNAPLAERICASGGLLVSPFPPQTPIMPYNFPIRNQLIAALCDALVVISAAHKSGALITAHAAIEYGKDVFVVPGSLSDPLHEGSNTLLREGAHPLLGGHDILEFFQLETVPRPVPKSDDPFESALLSALTRGPQTPHDLCAILQCSMRELGPILTKCEIKKIISRDASGLFRLERG